MSPEKDGLISRRDFLTISGGALAGIALGVSPAEADKSCGKPKYGGHFRMGERYHPNGLDPHRQMSFIETMNQFHMYDGLTARGSLPEVKIFPSLAQSWEISEDGRTYTFHLRAARFHHGKELTSADVKYSFDRIRDPKTGSPRRRDLWAVDSIDAVDRRTVRVKLKEPYGPFLRKLTAEVAPIIPEGTYYKDGTPPPGTGPFVFKEWKLKEYTRFTRNKNYWEEGLPYVDMVTVRGIPDNEVRFTALKTKEIDWVTTLPPNRINPLLKNPPQGVTIFVSPTVGRGGPLFNVRKTALGKPNPFSDVRVRRAVAYAIDKKELLQGNAWGWGEVLDQQIYGQGSPWYVNVSDYRRDLAKARALLAEAGYPEGFKSSILTRRDRRRVRASEIVQNQVKRIGIDLTVKIVEDPEFVRITTRTHEFTMAYEIFSYRDDPDDGYYLFFHSKSPANFSGYADAEFDRLVEEGRRLTRQEERREAYKKVVQKMHDDVPMIWDYAGRLGYAWRDYVKCNCAPGETNCWGFGGWFNTANGGAKRVWLDK